MAKQAGIRRLNCRIQLSFSANLLGGKAFAEQASGERPLEFEQIVLQDYAGS